MAVAEVSQVQEEVAGQVGLPVSMCLVVPQPRLRMVPMATAALEVQAAALVAPEEWGGRVVRVEVQAIPLGTLVGMAAIPLAEVAPVGVAVGGMALTARPWTGLLNRFRAAKAVTVDLGPAALLMMAAAAAAAALVPSSTAMEAQAAVRISRGGLAATEVQRV
jgi:hypothetical protein